MRKLTVERMIEKLELELISGEKGIKNLILDEMITRPGVELAGFLDLFDPKRLILIGSKESSFLKTLNEKTQYERLVKLFEKNPPVIIFSLNVEVSNDFIELGNKFNVPILKSTLRTTPLFGRIYAFLHSELSPRRTVHGVLVDIYGLGTLIIGKSGIGKSETGLELIKRGHSLISDDRVDVFEAARGVIVGKAPKILERYIEIRGIGIVDIVQMFGAAAYRDNKKIKLVVELEHWKKTKEYDRLGLEKETFTIFNTEIPKVTIPILPGRNVATLVESAAMNQKLKYFGFNAAEKLIEEVANAAKGEREDD